MDEIKGNIQLSIGREYEFYPISIELDAADEVECSPCVYAPQILKAEDYPLADIQIQLAWEKYQRQEKIGKFAQGDALNYSGSGSIALS